MPFESSKAMAKVHIERILRKADRYLKNNEIVAAVTLYKKILKIYPKNKKALIGLKLVSEKEKLNINNETVENLISLYNQDKKYDVVDKAKSALIHDPENFIIWNILGVSQRDLGNYKEALFSFSKSIQINPKYVDSLYNSALTFQSLNEIDNAILIYNKIILAYPKYINAYYNLGNLQRQKGCYIEALELYDKVIDLDKKHWQSYNNRGLVNNSLGNYSKAIEDFKSALEIDSLIPELYYNLGTSFHRKGEHLQALNYYHLSLKLQKNYIPALINLGIIYQEIEEYSLALKVFSYIPKEEKFYSEACYNSGKIFEKLNFPDMAILEYKESIFVNPNYIPALNDLGILLLKSKNFEEAEKIFINILDIDTENIKALHNIGLCFKERGHFQGAINVFQKVLKAKPDTIQTLNSLGLVYKDMNLLSSALQNFENAIKCDPSFASSYMNLADLQKTFGNLDLAVENYKTATSLDPNFTEAFNNLGNCYKYLGNYQEASHAYLTSLRLDPNNFSGAFDLVKMPPSTLSQEALGAVERFSLGQRDIFEHEENFDFFEANFLLHYGDFDSSFKVFEKANERKFSEIRDEADAESKSHDLHLSFLDSWHPSKVNCQSSLVKKLFILGPSRSGKSVLEGHLSLIKEFRPQYEAIKFLDLDFSIMQGRKILDTKGCLSDIFYEDDKDLFNREIKFTTVSNPFCLQSIIYILENIPDAKFLFLERDIFNVGAEIFTKIYNSKNFYAYNPKYIMRYLNYYQSASEIISQKLPERCLKLSFNELIMNPSVCLRELLDFLEFKLDIENFRNVKDLSFASGQHVFHEKFRKLL